MLVAAAADIPLHDPAAAGRVHAEVDVVGIAEVDELCPADGALSRSA